MRAPEIAIGVMGMIAVAVGLGCVIVGLLGNWRKRAKIRLFTLR